MLSGKTHDLYLEREEKKKTQVILRFFLSVFSKIPQIAMKLHLVQCSTVY